MFFFSHRFETSNFRKVPLYSKNGRCSQVKCTKMIAQLIYYWYCDAQVSTYYHIFILTLARIRCFAIFGQTGGGCDPLGVSKRSVVELSGKDQQIALAEYSRLVILFLVIGQYLTKLWQIKGQTCGNSMIFQLYKSISAKLSIVAAWGPSPACSSFNSAQNEVFWCISVEYLGRIVLIDYAVSHRWRHRSDLWRHGSVTWHAHMIGISTMDT